MLDNDIVEHLIRTADKVALKEKEYLAAKQDLELLKAKYILTNDWESLLGKSKPTQKEKDAYIEVETEELKRKVNDLKLQSEYCKRVFEIHMMANRY